MTERPKVFPEANFAFCLEKLKKCKKKNFWLILKALKILKVMMNF